MHMLLYIAKSKINFKMRYHWIYIMNNNNLVASLAMVGSLAGLQSTGVSSIMIM